MTGGTPVDGPGLMPGAATRAAGEPGEGRSSGAAGAPPPRPGGLRWGVALAGVAVVIGALAGVAALLTLSPRDETMAYVPADSIYVLGLRPDLPSDQRSALGTLISRFPVGDEIAGASDPVNAMLDHLVGEASDGARTYTGDLAAYGAGQMIVAAIPGSAPDEAAPAAGQPPTPDTVAVLSTDGSVGCEDLLPPGSITTEDRGGVQIRILAPDQGAADGPGPTACAANDQVILVGTPAGVRAALDARSANTGIAGDADYSTARGQLDANPPAWFFVRTAALAEMAATAPLPSGVPEEFRGLSASQPVAAWTAGQVSFETDAVVVETVTPEPVNQGAPDGSPSGGTASPRTLADRVPPSTVLLVDLSLSSAGALVPGPAASATPGVIETPFPGLPGASGGLLPFLGGTGEIPRLPGRAALIVTGAPDRAGAAVVMELSSAEDQASIAQLLALLVFSGGSQDVYEGTTILTIPISDLARSTAGSGDDLPPLPLGDESVMAVAVHGDLLVVGLGEAVVKAVIDTSSGATLADQDAYRAAMARAGSGGLPEVYVDVRALLPLLEEAALTVDKISPTGEPSASDEPRTAGSPTHWLESVSTIASRVSRADGYVRSRTIITIP